MSQRPDANSASPAFAARLLSWGVLLLALLPWFLIRVQQITNSDVLWLCDALSRIFAGGRMVDTVYEANPPLSLLIYTLPVLANSILHIPLHYAVFAQTLLLIVFSAYAIHSLLRHMGMFRHSFIDVITAAFILASTYGISTYFSERDQLIALGLIPFVLLQISITYNLPIPKYLKWSVLLIGTPLILLKPHHGLIPAVMLLQRLIRRRNLSILKDIDFLVLSFGTLIYGAIVYYYFYDYITIILPDAIRFYLPHGSWAHVATVILTTFITSCVLMIGMLYTPADKHEQNIGFWFIVCGLLSLIPYGVQGIGLYYQLAPALSFFTMGFAAALFSWFKSISPHRDLSAFCILILATLSLVHAPLILAYPTHENYKNLPLPKLLANECPKDHSCSFMMLNYNMGMIHETAYYSGVRYASRFAAFWFQDKMIQQKDNSKDFARFSSMITEDLVSKKPDIMVLIKLKDPARNFISIYSRDKNFARAISHYKKIKTIKMSYDEYYRGTGASKELNEYDVYKRITP